MLVRPGFEPTASRSADRRSPNWAYRAAVHTHIKHRARDVASQWVPVVTKLRLQFEYVPVHTALRSGRNDPLSRSWVQRSLAPLHRTLWVNRSPPNRCLCPGLCLNHTLQKDFRGILGMSFRFGPTTEILENIQYGGPSEVKSVILVWFLWRQDFNAGNK